MVTSPDYIHVGEKLSDIGNRVLYMRFPLKVPPLEKIKELHPGIINVRYPRQKSARFCHVIFASKEIADQARKQLNRQKYAEKGHLVVRSMKKLKGAGIGLSATKEDVTECKRLWIGQLPADTTTEQVCANFPGCTWSKLFKKSRGKKNLCSAVCVFSSHKEASAILNNPDAHKINDIPIVVQCAKHLTSGQKIKEDGSNTNQMRERTKKNKIKEKVITIKENSVVSSIDEEDSIQILSTQSNQKKDSSPKQANLLQSNGGSTQSKSNGVNKGNKMNGITTVDIGSDSEIEEVDSDKSEEDEEEQGDYEGMQGGSDESDGGEGNYDFNEDEDGEVETVELSGDDGGEEDNVETVSISDDGLEGSSCDDEKENMSVDEDEDSNDDTDEDSEVVEVDKSDDNGKIDSDGAGEVFEIDESDDSTKVDPAEIGVDDSDSEDSDDDDDDNSALENN